MEASMGASGGLTEDSVVHEELLKELGADFEKTASAYRRQQQNYSDRYEYRTHVFSSFLHEMSNANVQPVAVEWLKKLSKWVLTDERDYIKVDIPFHCQADKQKQRKLTLSLMFEAYVAALLNFIEHAPPSTFLTFGHLEVERVGKAGDNGVDVVVKKQQLSGDRNIYFQEVIIVQVKRGKSVIKKIQSIIRDLVGACLYKGTICGYLFTNARYADFGVTGMQNIQKTLDTFFQKGYIIKVYYREHIDNCIQSNEPQAKAFMDKFIHHLPFSWKEAMRLMKRETNFVLANN